MIRFEHRFEIERGPAEVFGVLTDVERIPEWQQSIIAVTKQTPGPVRAGTRVLETLKMAGRRRDGTVDVTAYTPGELVAFSGDVGLADYYCAFELTPRTGGGTVLVARTEFRLHGVWRLLRPVLGSAIRRESGRELATLKRLIEAGTRTIQAADAR